MWSPAGARRGAEAKPTSSTVREECVVRSLRLTTLAVGVAVTVPMAGAAFAAPSPDLSKSQVKPWTYIGKAGDCGPNSPAGTRIVDSRWLPHSGLLDAHGKADKALYLAKLGNTTDCSSAGASITRVAGLSVSELGFYVKAGTHCSGGAARFNVLATDGSHFIGGCGNMTQSDSKQDADGNQWIHMTADTTSPAQAFPPIAPGATVKSVDLVFDEGTDNGQSGSTMLDDIEVNGVVVGH